MTRGRRNNSITLPGARPSQEKIEHRNTLVAIHALAANGKITVDMFRAADQFFRDHAESAAPISIIDSQNHHASARDWKSTAAKRKAHCLLRVIIIIDRIDQRHKSVLRDMVLSGMALIEFGRSITGHRNDTVCKDEAMRRLRSALSELHALYSGSTKGRRSDIDCEYDHLARSLDLKVERR